MNSLNTIYKINGSVEAIDVFDLSALIVNYGKLMKTAYKELFPMNGELKISVKPIKKGSYITSFVIEAIQLAQPTIEILNNAEYIEKIKELLTTLGFIYNQANPSLTSLSMLITGMKDGIKEVIKTDEDKYKYIGNSNNEMIVDGHVNTLFQNCDMRGATINVLNAGNVKNAKGIICGVEGEAESEVKYNSDDLKNIQNIRKIEEEEEVKIEYEDVLLVIMKVVFEENRKWQFQYGDAKISAIVSDMSYLKKMHNKEIGFYEGDKVKCRLKIRKKFNKAYQVWEVSNYEIIEVYI